MYVGWEGQCRAAKERRREAWLSLCSHLKRGLNLRPHNSAEGGRISSWMQQDVVYLSRFKQINYVECPEHLNVSRRVCSNVFQDL